MPWSDDERGRFLNALDNTERVVALVYRALLTLVALAIVAVVAVVIIKQPWGAGAQGEWFYFTIAVLVAGGWVVSQFVGLRWRGRRVDFPATFDSDRDRNTSKWELQIGSPAPDGNENEDDPGRRRLNWSGDFAIPLASVARDMLPSGQQNGQQNGTGLKSPLGGD